MKKRVLVLAGVVLMMTGMAGGMMTAYARTVDAGAHSDRYDCRRDDWDDDDHPNRNRHYSGGPGTSCSSTTYYNSNSGYYGYSGGPGTVYNNNTLGYGTPTAGSTSYSTGAWRQDSNGWWYQFSNGTYPKNCWTVIDGSYYCFDANGYRRYGWILWNNKWYYCGTDGALLANTYTPDGYYVGSDGVWVR